MDMITTLDTLLTRVSQDSWLLTPFIIFDITLLVVLIKNIIFRRLSKKAAKSQAIWDDCLLHATTHPLSAILWVFCFSLMTRMAANQYLHTDIYRQAIDKSQSILLFSILAWFLVSLIRHAERDYIAASRKGKTKLDQTSIRAISQIGRIALFLSVGLIFLDMLGVPTAGIMTAGGVGGVAVGFAAKDLLANIFGGFVVFLDRPFAIGDWIKIADKRLEGTVEAIGWRTTMLRTFDKRALYVPNGIFLLASIENPSRMTNRRIKATIGVRFQDLEKIKAMLSELESILMEHDEIDTTQTLFVRLSEIGESSLNFVLYCFTKTTNWAKFQEVQQEVLLKVLSLIQKHDAECAFPTLTLHLADAEGKPGSGGTHLNLSKKKKVT